jgi:pimeloyl-ACP methyl ester carboxylesterase
MGDDMAALVKRLGHDRVDVMGYSLGGGVALRMALQRPEQVRRLVVVSTPFSDDAWYPAIKEQQIQVSGAAAPAMKDTPMYKSYVAVAPKVEDFPRLLDALGDFMREKYDWSAEIPHLKGPVMIVFGDGDMVRPEHVVKFYQLLGGGLQDAGWQRETMPKNRLAIIPDLTHYDIFTSPRLVSTVLPFLNGESDAKSWAEQVQGTALAGGDVCDSASRRRLCAAEGGDAGPPSTHRRKSERGHARCIAPFRVEMAAARASLSRRTISPSCH